MAAIDFFADICADGTEVQSSRGNGTPGVDFGGNFQALPEDGMFVRACSAFSKQYAVVKGHDNDTGYIINSDGATVSLGATLGNYCVCVQSTGLQIRAVWQASGTTYGTRLFSSTLTPAGAAVFNTMSPTSQGFLDLTPDGTPIFTDARRYQVIRGFNMLYGVFRAGWWIGQSDGNQYPDGIYGMHYLTGSPKLLHGQLAYEPHAALSTTNTVLWAIRKFDGTAEYGEITENVRPDLEDRQTQGQVGVPELAALYPHPVADVKAGGRMTRPWYEFLLKLTAEVSAPINLADVTGELSPDNGGVNPFPSGPGVPAPRDAEYIVGALDPTLTAERLLSSSTSVTANLSVAGAASLERSALTGDVTASANSNATTIAANAVTMAKLADLATQRVIGRNTAGTGDPEAVTASQVLDWIGSTRGAILRRGAAGWEILAPGTSGFALVSNGAGADPTYQAVTANIRTLLDGISTTQGVILYYNGTDWVALSPGTAGQLLQTNGAAANPSWANPPATGSWIPLVDGSEPPVFITDGAGVLILVGGP